MTGCTLPDFRRLVARLSCTDEYDHRVRLTDFLVAVRFPGGARHDLGLDEWLLCFLGAPLVHWIGRKQQVNDPPAGSICSAMVVASGVPRFLLGFLRATDLPRSDVRHFGLTFAQYGCVALAVLRSWFLIKRRSRGRAVASHLSTDDLSSPTTPDSLMPRGRPKKSRPT